MLSYEDSLSVVEQFYKDSVLWHRIGGKNIYQAIRDAEKEVELIERSPFDYIKGVIDPKAKKDFLMELNSLEAV